MRLWEPDKIEIVLGRGSVLEDEVKVGEAEAAGIPVRRRRGGGSAVVVCPGTLIIATSWPGLRPPYPVEWEEEMSGVIREALLGAVRELRGRAVSGVGGGAGDGAPNLGLSLRPGGDLAVGERKILGGCAYVGGGRAEYGASLLVNPDLALMDRFLKHPPREPEYRRGRSHQEFLTSLWREGWEVSVPELAAALGERLWEVWADGEGCSGSRREPGDALGQTYFLRAARLGFRRWSEADLELAAGLWGDPEVTRLIGGPFSEQAVRELLAREIAGDREHGVQYWPIFLLATDEHVGCCGLRPYRPDPGAGDRRSARGRVFELGFHLRRAYWGQGYGLEAARAAVGYAFGTLGASALFAGPNPANEASRRLLGKLGFRYTHGEFYVPTGMDHPSYLLTAEDRISTREESFHARD